MADPSNPRASAARYDLDAITAGLRATASAWVPDLFPNGRKQGHEWRLANIQGDPPRKSGSCVITLTGEHAGDWIDFDGGQGGGPLSTLQHGTGLSGRALLARAAEMAGWSPDAPRRKQRTSGARRSERDTARDVAVIRHEAVPITATPAETYLRRRGLRVHGDADLLFHPDLMHWDTGTRYPAMIGVVRDGAGEPMAAVHRTYLRVDPGKPEQVDKAPVDKPRMLLGKPGGGAVRLAPVGADGVLGLSEGIETGLAAMTACPGLPVWATLSTSGLQQAQLPPEAQRIIILADHDESGAGMRAAEAAARRLRGEGRKVAIALPPRQGDDFNDLLLREGAEAVRATIQAALDGNSAGDADRPVETGCNLPIGFVEPSGSLPALRADEGDLAQATDQAWALLLDSNRSPWLFRSGGQLSWVALDDEGRPIVVPVTEERLRLMLARLAKWLRASRNGDLVPALPPMALVKTLLATPDAGLPVLAGIVATPVFGRAGTLLTEQGYHRDARLLYHPAPGFRLPPVPERPTAEEIAEARSLLLEDLLGDFPFASEAERAHAVALLLLGFVRAMVDGPTPLHLIEKPAPGTGATLMVDAIATILTGVGASVMTEGRDDDEWRKRLTAKLRQMPTLVLIDNLRHTLDSGALAAALTAPFWEDRILGASEMARLPVRCVWVATGNNPECSNEMARRLVRIRLDAGADQPWRRGAFRHPDLMGWVRANRGRLVAACLTLCRAWIANGRPRGTRRMGSYEGWAEAMGGVLGVAGIEGFLGNLDEMLAAADGEGAALRAFVGLWWDRRGPAVVGTGDLSATPWRRSRRCPLDPAATTPDGSASARRSGGCATECSARRHHRPRRGRRHSASGAALAAREVPRERRASASPSPLSCHPKRECRERRGSTGRRHSHWECPIGSGLGESGEFGECFFQSLHARADTRPRAGGWREALPTPPTLPRPSQGRHFRQPRLGRVSAEAHPKPARVAGRSAVMRRPYRSPPRVASLRLTTTRPTRHRPAAPGRRCTGHRASALTAARAGRFPFMLSNASENPAVGASENPSTPVSPRPRRAPRPAPP